MPSRKLRDLLGRFETDLIFSTEFEK